MIIYEQPKVFDQSKSKGSIPVDAPDGLPYGNEPAKTTNIQLVRLMQARDAYRKPMVDVNLDPEMEGHYAAEERHQRNSCPYPKSSAEAKLWLGAFDDHQGVAT